MRFGVNRWVRKLPGQIIRRWSIGNPTLIKVVDDAMIEPVHKGAEQWMGNLNMQLVGNKNAWYCGVKTTKTVI